MGFLGSTRGLTPIWMRWRGQSVVFTRAYAQAPLTTCRTRPFSRERIRSFIRCSTLPIAGQGSPVCSRHSAGARISHRGISRLAWCWSAGVGGSGFDAGLTPTILIRGGRFLARRPRAGRRIQRRAAAGSGSGGARAGMVEAASGRAIFLVGAFVRCARSVSAAEPYKTKYAAEPYDGGIAYEDSVVGTLLQQLKARGL